MAYHALLNFLDRPPRILILTYDQVIGFVAIFLMFALALDLPELGILFGVIWAIFVPVLKKRIGQGALKRLFYWYFPTHTSSFSYYVPSFVREWIG